MYENITTNFKSPFVHSFQTSQSYDLHYINRIYSTACRYRINRRCLAQYTDGRSIQNARATWSYLSRRYAARVRYSGLGNVPLRPDTLLLRQSIQTGGHILGRIILRASRYLSNILASGLAARNSESSGFPACPRTSTARSRRCMKFCTEEKNIFQNAVQMRGTYTWTLCAVNETDT